MCMQTSHSAIQHVLWWKTEVDRNREGVLLYVMGKININLLTLKSFRVIVSFVGWGKHSSRHLLRQSAYPENPNHTALSGNVNNVLPGWCLRVSNARRTNIKYFNPELVFEALKAGDKTRKAINSQRAAAQRQGYFEHAERLRKGIELYDQWKAEQAETTTNE